MDVLSSVLSELKLEGIAYRRLELRAPWRISFDQQGVRGVHIVLRGRCDLVVRGGGTTRLEAGDIVVLPRADEHLLQAVDAAHEPVVSAGHLVRRSDHGVIRVPGLGEATTILCGAFLFGETGHPAVAGLPHLVHVPGEAGRSTKWLTSYVELLSAAALEGGPGSQIVMARLTDALIAQVLGHHIGTAAEPGWLRGLQDPYIAKALGVLHDDLSYPWTLESLALTAGLSRSAFAARFAEQVGRTPMRYLQNFRMQRAMELLRDERATVAQVAAQVGYGSEAALATAFKRQVGQTPGSYRRGVRAATEVAQQWQEQGTHAVS
jgi:AraC-like DNA-binding protein